MGREWGREQGIGNRDLGRGTGKTILLVCEADSEADLGSSRVELQLIVPPTRFATLARWGS